ncbi:nitronate monooxygenase [Endobacter medicaginis]|uniref:Nitronate monooxygenase n=1 Tax=Endobacter medicaginis TaxID=1181271 RepID=A0A839UWI6_9PROT|nr:nitronate monooxygenase family protein [Endobacter medicaginis]MBB3174668.1 nitronate monooxygenase [Endobacter medicaginis]MCX5474937.1 nitronate monooxygenase family protein [Endobacter medicaginis]NVN28947.1 nitronate monooxygenase [Endobacter medicaginis]
MSVIAPIAPPDTSDAKRRLSRLTARLALPAIGAPMFIVSTPELVIAQCRAGIAGCFPALNARGNETLDGWISHVEDALDESAAPFGVNLIVHRSNARLEADLATCVARRVGLVITSLGATREVNDAIHAHDGLVLHDVTNQKHARKAIENGADGLILVAAGAGGHAGNLSPFALVEETRAWFDGPIVLAGAIGTGRGVLAARAMGADLVSIGSRFIAAREANATDAYKQGLIDGTGEDIVYSDVFTGVKGNYLRASVAAQGLDPDNLPSRGAASLDMNAPKAWRDIWGCGQGIGTVTSVQPAGEIIAGMIAQYGDARDLLAR